MGTGERDRDVLGALGAAGWTRRGERWRLPAEGATLELWRAGALAILQARAPAFSGVLELHVDVSDPGSLARLLQAIVSIQDDLRPATYDAALSVLCAGFRHELSDGWLKQAARRSELEPEQRRRRLAFLEASAAAGWNRDAGWERRFETDTLCCPEARVRVEGAGLSYFVARDFLELEPAATGPARRPGLRVFGPGALRSLAVTLLTLVGSESSDALVKAVEGATPHCRHLAIETPQGWMRVG